MAPINVVCRKQSQRLRTKRTTQALKAQGFLLDLEGKDPLTMHLRPRVVLGAEGGYNNQYNLLLPSICDTVSEAEAD